MARALPFPFDKLGSSYGYRLCNIRSGRDSRLYLDFKMPYPKKLRKSMPIHLADVFDKAAIGRQKNLAKVISAVLAYFNAGGLPADLHDVFRKMAPFFTHVFDFGEFKLVDVVQEAQTVPADPDFGMGEDEDEILIVDAYIFEREQPPSRVVVRPDVTITEEKRDTRTKKKHRQRNILCQEGSVLSPYD